VTAAATNARFVEKLDSFLDSLEQGRVDVEIIGDFAHPDLEFRSGIGSQLDGRIYRGREGIADWFTEMSSMSELRYENRVYKPIGEEIVLFLGKSRLKGKGSGAEVASDVGVVYEFDDGLVRRVTSFMSHAEATALAEELSS
jgi:ketosteroid isomerase-like protein